MRTDVFSWIETHLHPQVCTAPVFIYDDMESQSSYQLPIIYTPFDGGNTGHWADRGAAWDFLAATKGVGSSVLDFGPGDGWPSLIIAPYVKEVTGIDASRKRVEVCQQNATRLGIPNATFVHCPAGSRLPFPDEHFDAVTAASSVEQCPDPLATLGELWRVLKPGGRLRLSYEGLEMYRGGQEQALWLSAIPRGTKIILFDRIIDQERVVQYAITVTLSYDQVASQLRGEFASVTPSYLASIASHIRQVNVLETKHPSGRTWVEWLDQLGFSTIMATHSGSSFAGRWHQELGRPCLASVEEVDAEIQSLIPLVVELPAPLELDPMITAVK